MLFFLGYRGQRRLPGNRDLTQTHDGLTLSPTECARLVRRTHSINRGGLSNPCGNETGHLSARTRFTVVELGTGLRYNDRTEVMLGGITEKMKVRKNSFFDMESLVGIIMSVCAKF